MQTVQLTCECFVVKKYVLFMFLFPQTSEIENKITHDIEYQQLTQCVRQKVIGSNKGHGFEHNACLYIFLHECPMY